MNIFFYYTLHLELDTSHRDECYYDCIILISTIPFKPEKAVSSYMRTLKDTLQSTTAAKHNIFFFYFDLFSTATKAIL